MMKIHVTTEQLLAWLDNEPGNDVVGWHVQHCEMCARHLADERLFRNLIKWKPGRTPRSSHADDEMLAAYAEEKLPLHQMDTISAHLIECDRCLLAMLDLRYMMHATDEHSPGEDFFGGIAERLGDLLQHWLGKIHIAREKGTPFIHWEPSLFPIPGLDPRPSDLSESIVSERAMFQLDMDSIKKGKDQYAVPRRAASHKVATRPGLAEVDAGDYHLSFGVSLDANIVRMDITVTYRADRRPVAELPLTLILADTETVSSKSDATGQIVFLLDQDEAELEIGDTPGWKLSISIGSVSGGS